MKRKTGLAAILAGCSIGYCCVSLNNAIKEDNNQYSLREDKLKQLYNNVYSVSANFKFEPKDPNIKTEIGFEATGTAYVIRQYEDSAYIVTNEHLISAFQDSNNPLIDKIKEISRTFSIKREPGEKGLEGKLESVYSNKEKDILVLKYSGKLPNATTEFPLTPDGPKVGEEAYIVGYPRNMIKLMSRGIVAGECDNKDCFLNIAAYPGSSGSPFFVERDNQLYFAGIVNRVMMADNNPMSYAIALNEKNFYADVMKAIEEDRCKNLL